MQSDGRKFFIVLVISTPLMSARRTGSESNAIQFSESTIKDQKDYRDFHLPPLPAPRIVLWISSRGTWQAHVTRITAACSVRRRHQHRGKAEFDNNVFRIPYHPIPIREAGRQGNIKIFHIQIVFGCQWTQSFPDKASVYCCVKLKYG